MCVQISQICWFVSYLYYFHLWSALNNCLCIEGSWEACFQMQTLVPDDNLTRGAVRVATKSMFVRQLL
jgi:hypothetical protein